MRFFYLLLIFTSAIIASSLFGRDEGTTLLVDGLGRLSDAIETIITTVNAYTGGLEAYAPIAGSVIAVNRTSRIAYYDAMTIKPRGSNFTTRSKSLVLARKSSVSIHDSNRTLAVVANPIQPVVTQAVDALIAKKGLIDAAGLLQETKNSLNPISYDHDRLNIIAMAHKLNVLTIPSAVVPVLRLEKGCSGVGGIPFAPLTGGQFAGSPVASQVIESMALIDPGASVHAFTFMRAISAISTSTPSPPGTTSHPAI